ncbi:pre-mRNA-splicing factor 38B-like [Homarus americanus]|uniref:Pre-mRNA-splicing factor 38 n=1 Tax=Homarus americanus TaxID=6706 RepID=A0A8J5NCD2_HOMAM|nr:pre-mRNA-splicing factor 38B-like [Homarus americanus]KAG7177102.1 Pre-mRNA-splicing factor 38B-like [Homarus americanus]
MKAGAYEYDEDGEKAQGVSKKPNGLPIWGNEKTMNLNPLILTNIQSSQYFKVNLYQLKTYHEVIDEIYYNVTHLEPWEKGSRKTSGQTGMCGGVRGVGAGGIVSTAFCILYKLYTLRLTRKQVTGLLNHGDSPYIRGLGFMYIRYTQPPADLWDWFESYMDDEEEIDVRAGGGQTTTIGQIVRQMLSKLDWYSTLFPRIPVPIQKDLEKKLADRAASKPTVTAASVNSASGKNDWYGTKGETDPSTRETVRAYDSGNKDYVSRERGGDREREREHERDRERDRGRDYERDRGKDRESERGLNRERDREYDKRNEKSHDRPREQPRERNGDQEKGRDRQRDREKDCDRERDHDRHRHKDKERKKSRSRSRDKKHRHRGDRYMEEKNHRDFDDLLEREKYRIKKEKKKEGSRERHHRSRSRDKERKHRY